MRFDAAPMTTTPNGRLAKSCWCSMLPSMVTKTSHALLARFRSAPFFVSVKALPPPWTIEAQRLGLAPEPELEVDRW